MKKLLLIFLLSVALSASLYAWQETYTEDSREFREMKALSRIAGSALPSPTSPVTGSQMLHFLESLDREGLSEAERKELEALKTDLQSPSALFTREPDVRIGLGASLNPQGFFHLERSAAPDDWIYPYSHWLPILDVDALFWLGRNVHAMTDLNFSLRKQRYKEGMFFSNIHREMAEFELAFPSKAYMSLGTESLNLILGRDELSAGNGITGNLVLGNNHWWKDFIKLSVAKMPFSYDVSIIAFDKNSDYDKDPLDLKSFDLNSEHKIVIIHRFSASPWKWFSVSVSEGALQFGNNILSDIRLLNPFMLIHGTNGYIAGNQNNFFAVELQFLPLSGLEFNLSAVFDQIQVKSEFDSGKPSDNTPPNANGFLANSIYSLVVSDGIATFYCEAVYTSPCLYLKNEFGGYRYYDTNLIVGNALWDDGSSDLSYLGYKYGPDTIAAAIGGNYTGKNGLEAGLDVLFKAHGEHGIRNRINQRDTIDLGMEHFYDVSPTFTEGVTLPEYRLVFSGYVEMSLLSWLDFSFNASYVRDWNHNNVMNLDYRDLQMALGFRIHTPSMN